eukprot:gb/GECG01006003.1/.p1 GENE.gb/GECG01006003.1/~~gb/GECG01006003.1/.p1  ORF type:complete len:328 (+),score=24.45 gb/GECG01006003.1/:1-984(+)
MEVPFVIRNVPSLNAVCEKWTDEYLEKSFGSVARNVEVNSHGNHFMYYNARHADRVQSYTPPTKRSYMTFSEWKHEADSIGGKIQSGEKLNSDAPHYYFRASVFQPHAVHRKRPGLHGLRPGADTERNNNNKQRDLLMGGRNALGGFSTNSFIAEDLEFFDAQKDRFFIVEPSKQRGIHCRFGMTGIVAESHYDAGRNFISMERGVKRYILAPPTECPNLDIMRRGPSARHSATNWADIQEAENKLKSAHALEVIIQEGDVLYVPSLWFHYIVSLTTNIQCNSRSGNPYHGQEDLRQCGHLPVPPAEDPVATNKRIKESITEYVQKS